MAALKKGHYDVCRLDLQTLLNTYPDSEYQMRAKLAIGDSWFKEGGSAAYTQAESEYKDFITFFPNVPEAAEAQMRVADIYYMQMEKPDRDYTNVQRAEQEYRQMINQFPDSPLIPRAQQHLRDVQEVLAQREYEIGTFYAAHENWAASIARLQTVSDTYPLFSHSDLTLIALGDDYAAQARAVQLPTFHIPPAAKEKLVAIYQDQAAAAYAKVVTKYAMAPHVEDAKDRLIALGRPVPEPTKEELGREPGRGRKPRPGQAHATRGAALLQGPSTVDAAHVGDATMKDPPPTYATQVSKQTLASYNVAMGKTPAPAEAPSAAIENGTAPPRSDQPAPAPQLENVPEGSGTGVGAEIVQPSSNGSGGTAAAPPATANPPATPPMSGGLPAPAAGTPATAVPDNGGLKAVGPADATALPAVDKPAEAPSQVNDVKSAPATVTTGTTSAAAADKSKYDASKESSSKHKKKKGLDKLNPF